MINVGSVISFFLITLLILILKLIFQRKKIPRLDIGKENLSIEMTRKNVEANFTNQFTFN